MVDTYMHTDANGNCANVTTTHATASFSQEAAVINELYPDLPGEIKRLEEKEASAVRKLNHILDGARSYYNDCRAAHCRRTATAARFQIENLSRFL